MDGGILVQDADLSFSTDFKVVTEKAPSNDLKEDLIFGQKVVKHVKSNAIVLVKDRQLIGAGMGQPNRVDALKQAIEKAHRFGFSTEGAVMASDAFFPFHDTVKTAYEAGVTAVIQPGGSIRDQESIDFCNENKLAMVFTGTRHFKH